MEGMIWNANHVLDSAIDPKTNGIPRDLFKQCKGVVLLSVIEAGFCFSGNVGTGVVMARADDGSWSPPSAVGLAGVGFGFMFGAETKDILILIMDSNTLKVRTFLSPTSLFLYQNRPTFVCRCYANARLGITFISIHILTSYIN